MLSGFELYPRWVPLPSVLRQLILCRPHFLLPSETFHKEVSYKTSKQQCSMERTLKELGKRWKCALWSTKNAAELWSDWTHTSSGDYSMNTYATLYFRDWRNAVSLCHKTRTKIIGLVCDQKPYPRPDYPVWFSLRRKSYSVYSDRIQPLTKLTKRFLNEHWLTSVTLPNLTENLKLFQPKVNLNFP